MESIDGRVEGCGVGGGAVLHGVDDFDAGAQCCSGTGSRGRGCRVVVAVVAFTIFDIAAATAAAAIIVAVPTKQLPFRQRRPELGGYAIEGRGVDDQYAGLAGLLIEGDERIVEELRLFQVLNLCIVRMRNEYQKLGTLIAFPKLALHS